MSFRTETNNSTQKSLWCTRTSISTAYLYNLPSTTGSKFWPERGRSMATSTAHWGSREGDLRPSANSAELCQDPDACACSSASLMLPRPKCIVAPEEWTVQNELDFIVHKSHFFLRNKFNSRWLVNFRPVMPSWKLRESSYKSSSAHSLKELKVQWAP